MWQSRQARANIRLFGPRGPVRLTAVGLVLAAAIAGASNAAAAPAAGYTASYVPVGTPGGTPYAVAVDPATGTVYLSEEPDRLIAVNASSGAVEAAITLPGNATSVAVDTATDAIYASTALDVEVIDGATNTLSGQIDVSGDIAVDNTTNEVFVTDGPDVWVINGSTNTGGFFSLGQLNQVSLAGIAVDESTGVLWVSDLQNASVIAVSEATHAVLDTVQLCSGGCVDNGSVAVNQSTDTVYAPVVSTAGPDLLDVINGSTFAPSARRGCWTLATAPAATVRRSGPAARSAWRSTA